MLGESVSRRCDGRRCDGRAPPSLLGLRWLCAVHGDSPRVASSANRRKDSAQIRNSPAGISCECSRCVSTKRKMMRCVTEQMPAACSTVSVRVFDLQAAHHMPGVFPLIRKVTRLRVSTVILVVRFAKAHHPFALPPRRLRLFGAPPAFPDQRSSFFTADFF